MNISMKLVYQYMAIFINFPPTSSRLHSLQVVNCDSNSRLVVNEDHNSKFRLERVKWLKLPAWKVEDRGFEPRCGIQVSKKNKMFLSCSHVKNLILWEASVTERQRGAGPTLVQHCVDISCVLVGC